VVFAFLALALIFGGVTVALLALPRRQVGPLAATPFFTLSRLSFGMYLNHFAVIHWAGPTLAAAVRRVVGANVVAIGLTLALVVACSAAIAALTFVLVERPFLLLRERAVRRPAAVPAGVLAPRTAEVASGG
jgi:peptidoglycan/LPS O-acetylase OafA/YrhL